MPMRARGFTLVELLIGIVILAILMVLALPTYRDFMNNTRIRSTAESLASGIKLAQVEAIRRNQNIEFIVDPATGWSIRDPIAPAILHSEPFSDAMGQLVVNPSPPPAVKLTYSGVGVFIPTTNPSDGSDVMTSIAVSHATVSTAKRLSVTTDPWGVGVRVCDPNPASHAHVRCPAGLP